MGFPISYETSGCTTTGFLFNMKPLVVQLEVYSEISSGTTRSILFNKQSLAVPLGVSYQIRNA